MEERILAHKRIGNRKSDITLIFLHGSAMTKEGMLPFASEFLDYNCVVFDLNAHGESKGKEPEAIEEFAEMVEYSIQKLQDKEIISGKIVLLGYSMGGAIVCEIAIRKKVQLLGVVLLSSGGNLKDYTPLVNQLKNMPIEQFKTEDIVGYLFGKDISESEEEKITRMFLDTKAADTIGYGDLMISNKYKNVEKCKEIHIPVLLVHGNDDNIVLPMASIETWRVIENSELLLIPYKGHAAIYEDVKLVRDKVLAFIGNC